jgi:hypothetical protein
MSHSRLKVSIWFQTRQKPVTIRFGKIAVWKFSVVLAVAGLASAEVRSVCLEDRVGLSLFSRKSFQAEMRKLLPVVEFAFRSGECPGPAVSLVIAAHPPARYSSALGLAHRSGARVFPELRIYTQAVRSIIGERASAAQFGRALARVAAHELGHYFHQRIGHDESGLMRASFKPAQLTSHDPAPFRAKSDH